MQHLLKVLMVTVPTSLYAVSATPLAAADRVALVGCDLAARDGPSATFLQIGIGPATGGARVSRSISETVAGLRCAKVLADLVDDGFVFQSASVSGRLSSQWISIWQSAD